MGTNLPELTGDTRVKKMGEHIDNRKNGKRFKKGFAESSDPATARHRRVSFKNYLREVEEELLETELEPEEEDGVADPDTP